MRKTVVFWDLWHTLLECHVNYEKPVVRYSNPPVQISEVYPFVRDVVMTTPGCTFEQMAALLVKRFNISEHGVRDDIVAICTQDARASEWLPGAVSLLERLNNEGFGQVLVTNIIHDYWKVAEEKLHIAQFFDSLFLTCDEEVSKPDQRVWERLQRLYPDVSRVMIGDSEDDRPPEAFGRFIKVAKGGRRHRQSSWEDRDEGIKNAVINYANFITAYSTLLNSYLYLIFIIRIVTVKINVIEFAVIKGISLTRKP